MWDATLCQMDSDGDGKSNGYELGDPACTWREGLAISNPPVSHPGNVTVTSTLILDYVNRRFSMWYMCQSRVILKMNLASYMFI